MIDAFFRAIERSGFGHRRSRRWLLKWGATLGGLTAISNRFGLPSRAPAAILNDRNRAQIKMKTQTHIADWSGRLRRMDSVVLTSAWRARHLDRFVGAGKLSCFFRRRDASYSWHLRSQSAIHGNGSARHPAMARTRTALGPPTDVSHWRAVDGS